MTCAEFEVAIEMSRRGALGASDADALEKHLESCASCRSYADLAKRTEDAMTGTAAATMGGIDWNALGARVRKLSNYYRSALWRTAALEAVLLPVVVLYTMPPDVQTFGWIFGSTLCLFVIGRAAIEGRRWVREAEAAARTPGDLLAFCRKDLDRRIKIARVGLFQAFAGLFILTPLVFLPHWSWHDLSTPQWAFTFSVAGLISGQGLWWWLWQGPRLRRERAALGEPG